VRGTELLRDPLFWLLVVYYVVAAMANAWLAWLYRRERKRNASLLRDIKEWNRIVDYWHNLADRRYRLLGRWWNATREEGRYHSDLGLNRAIRTEIGVSSWGHDWEDDTGEAHNDPA